MAETSGLSSTLHVPATTATNGTLVKCIASLGDVGITSESSRVYVFGMYIKLHIYIYYISVVYVQCRYIPLHIRVYAYTDS